ncbi:MAG: BON domain-containing protein [Gemmatimonas sp.]|nr:BON domain-containing protein [Gemmatimonas sp.]
MRDLSTASTLFQARPARSTQVHYDAEWRRYPPSNPYPGGVRGYGWGWAEAPSPGRPQIHGYDDAFGQPESRGVHGPGRYGLGPYYERLRRRRRPDDVLREDIEQALFYDTWIDADAISVEVEAGVVTLRGNLPTYEEVRIATDDAWDIEGVIGVRTELRVSDQ